MDDIVLKPIGFFKGPQNSPLDSPKQGVLAKLSTGEIVLESMMAQETLCDLADFSHIWLIYQFHQNKQWGNLVRPPRGGKKRGVFATRSPYRPNGLGLSCVELVKIEGKKLYIKHHDLLNGTPIFDIKPYLVYADSFPQASPGWLNESRQYQVSVEKGAVVKLDWLQTFFDISLRDILNNQLKYEPANGQIKRVKKYDDYFVFSFRTWRFIFNIYDTEIKIIDVQSGYSAQDLSSLDDPYSDKALHKEFLSQF